MELQFEINNKTYEVPSEINLDLFEKAIQWDLDDIKNHKPFVSVITQCPMFQLDLLEEETFSLILGLCVSKIDVSDSKLHTTIDGYKLRDLSTLSFGDFIDLDMYVANNPFKHIVKITSMLYNMKEEDAINLNIQLVIKSIEMLIEFRNSVYKDYAEFFEINEDVEADDEISSMNLEQLQYMWYEVVVVLADSKFLDIHKVVERPYKEALNYATYKKNEIAKAKLENLRRKNEISRSR